MKHFSGKDKKQLMNKLPNGYTLDKKDEIIIDDNNVIFKNKIPYLILRDNQYLPHLRSLNKNSNSIPSVYIDKGAIPYLMKGADIMRPGIQIIEGEFENEDIIIIKDENHSKPLGLGFALMSSEEMKSTFTGKSISIYHYVNDSYY